MICTGRARRNGPPHHHQPEGHVGMVRQAQRPEAVVQAVTDLAALLLAHDVGYQHLRCLR